VPVYLVVALLYCLVNYAISRASQRLGGPMHLCTGRRRM